jgi:predicted lipoprotein with Yx(FWY)xxD motif
MRIAATLRALAIWAALAASFALTCTAASSAATPAGAAAITLQPGPSDYGRILLDGKGFALYAFTRDGRGRSRCTGACARAWPPYIVRGPVRAAAGVAAGQLGVTRRADGRKQVTFDGRPLYYYVGDRQPGQVLCQNVDEFGGLWLVVRPSGRLVR